MLLDPMSINKTTVSVLAASCISAAGQSSPPLDFELSRYYPATGARWFYRRRHRANLNSASRQLWTGIAGQPSDGCQSVAQSARPVGSYT
jgi:hypothetical protein